MTDITGPAASSALVPGAHRVVRTVTGGEGPFSGSLVAYEDSVAVCVDVEELAGWAGWGYSDTDHVCGILDVQRRRDGHDALLPWCSQRVETFLGRRRAADAPLAAGEIATLAASFLRGIRELGDTAPDAIGDWWLTGDGRPLFVHGDGGTARSRTAGLFERVTAHTNDRATQRILGEVSSSLRERRHHHQDDVRWEDELLAIAAPRALRMDVFAPEKAVDVHSARALRPAGETRPPLRRSLRETRMPRRAWRGVLTTARAAVGTLRDGAVSLVRWPKTREPRDAASARQRHTSPTRRRALVVASALAVLVLAVGLLWPEGQEREAARAAQASSPPASAMDAGARPAPAAKQAATATEAPWDAASPAPERQALDVVPSLLRVVATCVEAGAELCPAALSAGLSTPDSGPVIEGPDRSTYELVDDYGDVAVVRITPTAASAESAGQILVLERENEKWLVRDIYDVAHQPD